MRIAHHYWHANGNWGDRAIALGIQNLCRKFLGDCSFEIFPISSLPFANNKEVKRLNSCDFMIVGGGGIIGWYPRFQEFLNKIEIPMIVYGIGLNTFRNKEGEEKLSEYNIESLRKVMDKATYFSVRNDGSKEALKTMGIIIDRESPDPILWSTLDKNFPRLVDSEYAIIQVAGDYPWERYVYNGILPISFCKKIHNIVEFLVKKGYKIQFPIHQIIEYPTTLTNDEICFPYVNSFEESIIPWNWKDCIKNIDLGISYYSHAKMVIAMRSHSLMVGIATYRPSISLGTQNKNLHYMRNMGLEKYHVKIGRPDFEDIVKSLILEIEENWQELSDHNRRICSNLFMKAESDFDEIKEILRL